MRVMMLQLRTHDQVGYSQEKTSIIILLKMNTIVHLNIITQCLQQVQTLAVYLWVKTSHRFCTLHCPRLAYRNEIFTGTDRTSPLAHNLMYIVMCMKKGETNPY